MDEDINFVLSMVPLADKKIRMDTLPDHFFLDDKVLMSLGHADVAMMSVLTSVKEIIAGQRLCEDLVEEELSEEQVEFVLD